MMLNTGETAPSFSLYNADMALVETAQYAGKFIVLYFYPQDNAPSCTLEAIEFSDLEADFSAANAVVLGVSHDDCFCHASFRYQHGLNLELLADDEFTVCSQYGVCRLRVESGKTHVQRSTFVIDPQGVLRLVQYGVTAKGHAADVLAFVQSLALNPSYKGKAYAN